MTTRSALILGLALLGALHAGGTAGGTAASWSLKDEMTAAEFERAGLHRLTAAELGTLEAWLASHCRAVRGPASGAMPVAPVLPAAAELVAFNTANGKFHCLSCEWAVRCTRNCIKLPLSAARARGGIPCKVCGGSCR
jgi:hypothetical protein